MSKQLDTRLKIVKCFAQFMQSNPLDTIKVCDICKTACISRTTFYAYFQDIYSIVQWYWDCGCKDSLYRIGIDLDWYDGHKKMFEYMLENKFFFMKACVTYGYNSILEYGYRNLFNKYTEYAKKNFKLNNDQVLQIDYMVKAYSAMTIKWAIDGMVISPGRMAGLFKDHAPGFLLNAIKI